MVTRKKAKRAKSKAAANKSARKVVKTEYEEARDQNARPPQRAAAPEQQSRGEKRAGRSMA